MIDNDEVILDPNLYHVHIWWPYAKAWVGKGSYETLAEAAWARHELNSRGIMTTYITYPLKREFE